ncbi:hypothetical protein AVEN_186648-1 [Araneus ventricosus]|uniref:Uncharacterized protein n=1 Tax=Araneus ventricosus TaxID=182803 RepID=A0A4Y2I1P2_ARAVE|nr:hypothetical protein AVEN_186648-1 [Araneus ventricosus]
MKKSPTKKETIQKDGLGGKGRSIFDKPSFLFAEVCPRTRNCEGTVWYLLYYRHEKNPRHQTCLWRVLWKRDIPLHFGGEGKVFISFGADRTDGSLYSLCTTVENDLSPY